MAWYLQAVTADPDKVIAPAAGDEARLWSLLEAAWAQLGPGVGQARQALVVRSSEPSADTAVVEGALPDFLDALRGLCQGLSADELIALDRVVERKLWEIDRADVHAVIGGSDDGFLYARGFTVAMGREFHGCVAGDPRMGVPWAECEEMCYFFAHLHHERFGAFPDTGSGISRESGQNLVGWVG
jgi:hypothetical protein